MRAVSGDTAKRQPSLGANSQSKLQQPVRLPYTSFACWRVLRPSLHPAVPRHAAGSVGRHLAALVPLAAAPTDFTYTSEASRQRFEDGPIILWFKHDLRLDDHPGLTAALASGKPIIPLYCFDPRACGQLLRSRCGIEALLRSVASLRAALEAAGSGLVVRCGSWDAVLPAFAEFVGASRVLTEDEVEYRWLDGMERVERVLPADMPLQRWNLHVFGDLPYPTNYREFAASHASVEEGLLPPLDAPVSLPPLPAFVEVGPLPALDSLRRGVARADAGLLAMELEPLTTKLGLQRGMGETYVDDSADGEDAGKGGCGWPCGLAGGEAAVLEAYRAYLRYQEPRRPEGFDELWQAVQAAEGPATPGGSFRQVFGVALQMGLLSRRRAYAEAAAYAAGLKWYEDGSFRSPKTHLAALKGCEAWDYYWQMATLDRTRECESGCPVRHWRWRGVLTDYVSAQPQQLQEGGGAHEGEDERPAILLVHGFGAFGAQWRGQVRSLAAAGYRVYAATFPGYGRAEKPPLAYGQQLWAEFLRDFVVDVVRRPVVVAGNSIGGFIGASLAADYPQLVKGLVLMNSAGRIEPNYDAATAPPERPRAPPPSLLVNVISSALFFYLERNIATQLARLYPANPQRADAWLAEEIYRAACDPGAVGVFRSVFYLPPPRPLNHLVTNLFGGPTLVLQGALDPLNDARKRAQQLRDACPNVTVQLLECGHCPHDEMPEEVNSCMLDFIQARVLPAMQQEQSDLRTQTGVAT